MGARKAGLGIILEAVIMGEPGSNDIYVAKERLAL